MASAKQIAWRKKFARMSKAGKFRKKKSSSSNSNSLQKKKNAEITKVERRMEKIENQLLSPRLKSGSAKEKRLTKEMKKLQDQVSFIQFRKYN